ncbi:hypothetical protein [Streptomyces sp. NPDC051677]|uniref:hypothetical protein n=1 Tax=Streptomyces sp. NPDC051677 TaxID=3365669 RepID=UPI0037D0120C
MTTGSSVWATTARHQAVRAALQGSANDALETPPRGPHAKAALSTHAEWNAIFWSRPEDRPGATLYVTFKPCGDCSKLITGVGIARVVWDSAGWYGTPLSRATFEGHLPAEVAFCHLGCRCGTSPLDQGGAVLRP